jgi:hypothetical protein
MKTLFSFLLFMAVSVQVMATAQMADKIIYKGNTYKLFSNPLAEYFQKFPERKPTSGITSTALWRGYVATFEIRDNQLFLKDIEIMKRDTTSEEFNTIWVSVLDEVVPDKKPLKIDWFTGLLIIPYGNIVNYVHMGYASTYENYILLEIDKGSLRKEKDMSYPDYEKFKEKQFQAFKQTEEYKQVKAKLQKDGSSDAFIDNFLKSYIINYTSKILGN